MKPVVDIDAYIANFITARKFLTANLYTITLQGGDIARFTNLDFNLKYSGNMYSGTGLIIEGLQYKTSVGWNTDEQDIKIMFRPDSTLAGSIFSQAVVEGLLNGAQIKYQRAMWKSTAAVAMMDYANVPDEVFTLFTGQVSTIDKIGRTFVELKVCSPLKMLDIEMPRNNYQSGCQWSLFDQGCEKVRADYTTIGSVLAPVGDYGIAVGGGVTPATIGEDGDPYYAQGRIHFTSGEREGLVLTIRTNDDNNIYFMYPPITGLVLNDTFEMWPGCSKRTDTCLKKFDNIANFRGFPRVPPIHITA